MTHAVAMGHELKAEQSECGGDLVFSGTSDHSDVFWTVYRCNCCGRKVWTVGGGQHWWNYEEER